jgi:hypothetical protein
MMLKWKIVLRGKMMLGGGGNMCLRGEYDVTGVRSVLPKEKL